MKYIFAFLLMLSASCWAQVPMTGAGKSAGAAPVVYTGLGDLSGLTSPVAYWGTDGVTNAYSGNALNVCDAAGANCGDFTVTNGQLNVSVRGSTNCTGGTCVVATIYDQTAGGNCSGSCNLVQATNGSRATLTANCPTSGHWCITFASGNFYRPAGTMTVAYPLTSTWAFSNTDLGSQESLYFDAVSYQNGYHNPSAGNAFSYNGVGVFSGAATDGSFHSISSVNTTTTQDLVVDGSSNTASIATSGGINGRAFLGTTDGSSQPVAGRFCNFAIYSFNFTSGEKTSASTNQHSFACGGGF